MVPDHFVELIDVRTSDVIRIIRNDPTMHVGQKILNYERPITSQILCYIASKNRETASYSEIFDLLRNNNMYSDDDVPSIAAHKEMSKIDKELKTAGLQVKLWDNVRGKGYRLSNYFQLKPSTVTTRIASEVSESLNTLAQRCVAYVHNREIIIAGNGMMFLDYEPDVAVQNFQLVDRLRRTVLEGLSLHLNYSEIGIVKQGLDDILSYMIFWRIGENLSKEKWKLDFEREITAKMRIVLHYIESVRGQAP
jgi:hypothetical protein